MSNIELSDDSDAVGKGFSFSFIIFSIYNILDQHLLPLFLCLCCAKSMQNTQVSLSVLTEGSLLYAISSLIALLLD
jgi:hypothetical protein